MLEVWVFKSGFWTIAAPPEEQPAVVAPPLLSVHRAEPVPLIVPALRNLESVP